MPVLGTRFSSQVRGWADRMVLGQERVIKGVWKELYAGILARSPVKTGRFRDSNRIGVNTIDTSVEAPRSTVIGSSPFAGGPKLTEGEAIIDGAPVDATIWMTNNLPYAQRLESGYSPQAPGPGGIYQATYNDVLARLDSIIRREAGLR